VEATKRSARGILAIWNDCRPGTEREYEEWYRGEHLPERVSIPGFRAAWRFRALEAEPEYFTYYETTSPEVLFSAPYEARVNEPTALTRRIMSGVFRNATRALLTEVESWGLLRGAFAVSLRFDSQPGDGLEPCLRTVATREDVLRAGLWKPIRSPMPQALSAEQELRGPDKSVAAAAVVETLTEQEARAVAAAVRGDLGTAAHVGVYRLLCALGREDIGR
jgi:hypothetical protein